MQRERLETLLSISVVDESDLSKTRRANRREINRRSEKRLRKFVDFNLTLT